MKPINYHNQNSHLKEYFLNSSTAINILHDFFHKSENLSMN